jgi:hypothetical protein
LIDYALWLIGRRRTENGRTRVIESDEDWEDKKKEDAKDEQDDDDGSVFA